MSTALAIGIFVVAYAFIATEREEEGNPMRLFLASHKVKRSKMA